MNIDRIRASRRLPKQSSFEVGEATSQTQLPVSRRQFVRTSASAVVAGAALGSGILRPSMAHAFAGSDPVAIPGGTPLFGGAFHVYAPGADPVDAEPATITDFNGFVGLAYISGTVTRRKKSTGAVDVLPFLEADMRFMHGVYRGQDGRVRRGAFGLI